VAVKGSSPDTKTASTGTGSDAETEHTTLGTFVEVVDPESGTITTVLQRNATEAQRNTSAPTEQSRKREADVRYKHAARRRLKLSLDIVGDPLVPTKTVVATRGLGDYLNGNYYVKEATHVISGSGYACKLQLRSDAPKRGTGQTTAAKQNRNKAPESSAGGTAPGTETELSEVVNEQTGESQFVRQ